MYLHVHQAALRLCLLLVLFLILLPASSQEHDTLSCTMVEITPVQLADMNIPRSGHAIFVLGDEVVVVGGHTKGFVPTATAEFYRDGEWHLEKTVYPHDHGFSVPLSSGHVIIGGGHAEPLGIGHIFSVERFEPLTQTFNGFGCLDTKRCFATGTELDSGRVVITGNWYQSPDDIEMFDGVKYFHHLKPVAQSRCHPYVLPIGGGDAIIFSGRDHHADPIDSIIIDRIKGEPFSVPLFNRWRPVIFDAENYANDAFIGNKEKGIYAYLVLVEDREDSLQAMPQVAIAKISLESAALEGDSGTTDRAEHLDFSLLPTSCVIPMYHDGSIIHWHNPIVYDPKARRAYIVGCSVVNHRVYVLAIDMTAEPAMLTLHYTAPQRNIVYERPVLTSDGDLMLCGGTTLFLDSITDNFAPDASVLLLPVGHLSAHATHGDSFFAEHVILLIIVAAILLLLCIVYLIYRRQHRNKVEDSEPMLSEDMRAAYNSDLMQRLCQLMEEQQLYHNSNLKREDVAKMLNTNRTYITDCIKATTDQTFTQFVNAYRVKCAKRLLSDHSEKKMSAVAIEAGFASESSFFRTFKTVTGVTPTEWREQKKNRENQEV